MVSRLASFVVLGWKEHHCCVLDIRMHYRRTTYVLWWMGLDVLFFTYLLSSCLDGLGMDTLDEMRWTPLSIDRGLVVLKDATSYIRSYDFYLLLDEERECCICGA